MCLGHFAKHELDSQGQEDKVIIQNCLNLTNCLFFCKVPDSKYSRRCGSLSQLWNFSTLSLCYQNSPRQLVAMTLKIEFHVICMFHELLILNFFSTIKKMVKYPF